MLEYDLHAADWAAKPRGPMHDRNGTPIKAGDVVLIEARVVNTTACEDYCNATLLVGHGKAHGPDNVQSHVTINARQALLLVRAE